MTRVLSLAVLGLVLAALLAVQAISSVLSNRNPDLASQIMPFNGTALQAKLRTQLGQDVTSESDLRARARELLPAASEAFRSDPLGPTAYSIAILAAESDQQKRALIDSAGKLNRRALLLQGVTLDMFLRDGDFAQSFATLDRMLKVHPERRPVMFPVLAQTLQQEEALPVLVNVVDGSSSWHSEFYQTAVRDDVNAVPLARMRLGGDGAFNEDFDRALMRALMRQGEIDVASAVYREVTGASSQLAGDGALDWSTRLAPFDWQLADEGGYRAQPSPDGAELEIFIRGGKGGLIAERMISPGSAPFSVSVDHQLGPADQVRDARLELRCIDATEPFISERFVPGNLTVSVSSLPNGCNYVMLGVNARAWSGKPSLTGTIQQISLIR